MAEIPPPPVPTQLIVFADDWGRHPSSSQHLIRELLPQYKVLWVNTVGTRKPRLKLADVGRGMSIAESWLRRNKSPALDEPGGLHVVSPPMYPGYRKQWQRRFNAKRVCNAIERELFPGHRHVAVTTLPTTADLVGMLAIDRWVYYCVDDYSQWPGTDHAVMDMMERALVAKVDTVACVSETLQRRIDGLGRVDAGLLPHGVHLEHWNGDKYCWAGEPTFCTSLFWGLIDERIDVNFCKTIAWKLNTDCEIALRLIGPQSARHKNLQAISNIELSGPRSYEMLPAETQLTDVLIMPYIDAPVTRAMQPLKLLEYLATMKPVVVRDLPSTRAWADCCDLAADANTFVRLVEERIKTGTPPEQLEARKRRLASESWTAKAAQLAELINAGTTLEE